MILETKRLYLREMNPSDFNSLCRILQDEKAMYAYEGAFSDQEVQEWLDRQIYRYQKWNFGLWAAVLKETDKMIGQCSSGKIRKFLKSAICSKDHTGIRDMPLKRQKHVNNTHLKN